ncbi:MAG: amino acid permease, partial [Mycobacterium sp.]
LVVGTVFVLVSGHHPRLANLTAHGGFFPRGVGAVFAAVVVVIFSMVGAEIVTVAAAESSDPQRAVERATRSVVARIGIFFVGSVFLLVVILPWNSVEPGASPYVAALRQIGLPGADQVMNAVVLTAVLSCLNSGLYTASRMLFVLAQRGQAPARLVGVSGRGVPHTAILWSSAVGFGCVAMAWVAPDTVFLFLLNSSGAVILFVYWLIALSQIVLRRRTPAEQLRVKMWLFPVLSVATLGAITAVLVQMAFDRSARGQLWLSLVSWAVLLGLYVVARAHSRARGVRASGSATPPARTAAWRKRP